MRAAGWVIGVLLFGLPLACARTGGLGEDAGDDHGDDDVATGDDDTAGDDDTGDDDDTAGDDDTTEWPGDPVAPGDVEGHVYDIDLLSGEFVEPPGVGSLLAQYMTEVHPVVHVYDVDDADGTIELALEVEGASLIGDWDNPHFEVGSFALTLEIEGIETTLTDVTVAGDFTDEGARIVHGALDGIFDTRFMDPLIDPGASEGATCELMASLGIECITCPGDGALMCLYLRAEGFQAERVDD